MNLPIAPHLQTELDTMILELAAERERERLSIKRIRWFLDTAAIATWAIFLLWLVRRLSVSGDIFMPVLLSCITPLAWFLTRRSLINKSIKNQERRFANKVLDFLTDKLYAPHRFYGMGFNDKIDQALRRSGLMELKWVEMNLPFYFENKNHYPPYFFADITLQEAKGSGRSQRLERMFQGLLFHWKSPHSLSVQPFQLVPTNPSALFSALNVARPPYMKPRSALLESMPPAVADNLTLLGDIKGVADSSLLSQPGFGALLKRILTEPELGGAQCYLSVVDTELYLLIPMEHSFWSIVWKNIKDYDFANINQEATLQRLYNRLNFCMALAQNMAQMVNG